jgi:hypothetical protein
MKIKCAFDVAPGECAVLSGKSCEKCSFFKSEERLAEGREKAEKRVKSLPPRQQAYIYDKYYSKRQGRPINADSKED